MGIDAGSTYIKVAILDTKEGIWSFKAIPTLPGYESKVKELVPEGSLVTVTGYCRRILADVLGAFAVNEIAAQARGVCEVVCDADTVIDIGGQDTKVIRLDRNGRFTDFVMNDRCAAGTGRFLEVVSRRLGVSIKKLDDLAKGSAKEISISSMCVVFAESEIVSLMAKGVAAEDIARAVFKSVAERVASLAKGFGLGKRVVFTGGAASSETLKEMLEKALGVDLIVPAYSQFTCAMGAALLKGKIKKAGERTPA